MPASKSTKLKKLLKAIYEHGLDGAYPRVSSWLKGDFLRAASVMCWPREDVELLAQADEDVLQAIWDNVVSPAEDVAKGPRASD